MNTVLKSNWGGIRAGAGRKPRLQHEAREVFNLAVDERWDKILEHLDVWILQGDKGIIRFILEQRFGKAPQNMGMHIAGPGTAPENTNTSNLPLEEIATRLADEIIRHGNTK